MLDVIVNYAPSPADAAPAIIKNGDKTVEVKPDPSGPLCGLVFRVGFDPRSNMKYAAIRIFSGQLTATTQLMVNDARKAIRPGHPLKMQGVEPKEVESGVCGDIVSLAKIDELHLGALVHDGKFSGKIELPPIPNPMFSLAMAPAARGDENKNHSALDSSDR